MKRFLFPLLLIFCAMASHAQIVPIYGDEFIYKNRNGIESMHFLPNGKIKIPGYKNGDTTYYLTTDTAGNVVLRKIVTSSGTGGNSGITAESDPIFSASAANNISLSDIANWSNAYSWGNHALAGYETQAHASTTYANITSLNQYLQINKADSTISANADVKANTIDRHTHANKAALDAVSGINTGDQDLSGLMQKNSNLADVSNVSIARQNLGLGSMALMSHSMQSNYINFYDGTQLSATSLYWDPVYKRLGNTLNLASGTTSIAALNMPMGTLRAVPQSGDIENDGVNLYYTNSGGTRMALYTGSLTAGSSYIMYNTADQITNYERIRMYWSNNQFNITSEYAGTGVERQFRIGNSSAGITYTTNGFAQVQGKLYVGSIVALSSVLSGTNGTEAISFSADKGYIFKRSSNPSTLSSGAYIFGQFNPDINQTGTAGYTGIRISAYEQSTGSGTKYLIDAGTNSAASAGGTHTSKFNVDNVGNITNTGYTTSKQFLISDLNTAPAAATDTGTKGEIRVCADFIYVCVATNTWVRTALATW